MMSKGTVLDRPVDEPEVVDISVVICTRNRAASLSRTLESIRNAAAGWTMTWELVILNNGSHDTTEQLLMQTSKEGWAALRFIEDPTVGLSQVRNRVAAEARGSVLVFTDDDCLVTPRWLTEFLRPFQEDPDVGLVAGGSELANPSLFPHCVHTSRVPKTYRWPVDPWFGAGNNLAVRATAFRNIGGFDTRFGPGTRVHGAEDNDLIYRILRAGYVARFAPDALLYHDHGRSDSELWAIRRNYAVGAGAFYAKHILSGDLYAARMAYRQVRWLLFGGPTLERLIPDRRTTLRAMAAGALRRVLHLD